MKIGGLQKVSLIDYPNKISCVVFLFGCNFKCGFCHNPGLVIPERADALIPKEEVLNFLEKRKKYLDGVCISGGEPLMNSELLQFLEEIKKLGYAIKLDTNGTNPSMLNDLINRKLVDYIAMDIKSDEENYSSLTSSDVDLKLIEESIKTISYSGIDYEFRTTCISQHHTKDVIEKIGKWVLGIAGKKPKNYFLQRFVRREGGLIDDGFMNVGEFSDEELEELRETAESYFENVEVRE